MPACFQKRTRITSLLVGQTKTFYFVCYLPELQGVGGLALAVSRIPSGGLDNQWNLILQTLPSDWFKTLQFMTICMHKLGVYTPTIGLTLLCRISDQHGIYGTLLSPG